MIVRGSFFVRQLICRDGSYTLAYNSPNRPTTSHRCETANYASVRNLAPARSPSGSATAWDSGAASISKHRPSQRDEKRGGAIGFRRARLLRRRRARVCGGL